MRKLSALLFLPLTACATMMGGAGPAHVPIDSVPQGAIVSYDGANVGVTPCTVVMTARCSRVTLTREGFHEQVVEAGKSVNGAILGNLLFGGIVGLALDGAAGAAVRGRSDPCWIELTPRADPRPGSWRRPRPTYEPTAEDQGWIPEGQTTPVAKDPEKRSPTRAAAWTDADDRALRPQPPQESRIGDW